MVSDAFLQSTATTNSGWHSRTCVWDQVGNLARWRTTTQVSTRWPFGPSRHPPKHRTPPGGQCCGLVGFNAAAGKQLFSFLVGAVFHFSSALVSISFSPPFPFLRLHFSISISPLPLHVCISILPFLHYSFHFSSSVYCSSSIPPFLQSDCRNCERAMACALTSKSSRQITFGAQNHGPHYSSIATYMLLSC